MASWFNKVIPTKNDREIKRLASKVREINALEPKMQALPDEALKAKTDEFRQRFKEGYKAAGGDPAVTRSEGTKEELAADRKKIDGVLNALLPEAFAVVREAGIRVLGMRHYDVQLIGGMVLHDGKIAEMRTGEGKTLVATLAVYLNAIAGRGVHLITVNEYLAQRDAGWMGQLYQWLGLSVGVIANGMDDEERQAAYKADITYGTNSEFGFDYLRDNMKLYLEDYVQRGPHFAIVDEVDSILIDEARTPLIISGPAEDSTDQYLRVNRIIPSLRREQDYTVDEKSRTVLLTESGIQTVEDLLKIDNLYEPDHIEYLHHINQALSAHTLHRRDVDYMIQDGKIKIIDEFTGRVLEGRRWSNGLHQAVEAKEGVPIENENQTLATITYQNYFRMFLKLAGMTGTAETEAEEFQKIYKLPVIVVPTNKPVVRKDEEDLIFKSEGDKFQAIAEDIQTRVTRGQPCLVGTVSVEKSEVLSRHLKRLKIPHNVLNAKYHEREAEIVAQAGSKSAVTIATNMAGRGTDIVLGGNAEFLAAQEVSPDEDPAGYEASLQRLQGECSKQRDEVLEAGGLCIIGTERHDSRRIDNQLRGRSGRQGDPGASRFFVSLEDDLMRIFGGEKIIGLMERLGMEDGEVIEHRWVSKSIENAQRKVEGHNFDIRKHLIEYDDVMNEQRKAVYELRRDVLGNDPASSKEAVLDMVDGLVVSLVVRACPEKTDVNEWDFELLTEMIKEQFGLELDFTDSDFENREDVENKVFGTVESYLQMKEETYGQDGFYSISRIIHLQTIDTLWKEHLREMDHLREGINLRGYAQKDPKHEYKKEGFNLFATMMATIAGDVLQKVCRVVITSATQDDYEERMLQRKAQQEREMKLQAAQSKTPEKQETVRRVAAKVGRNEPCPCGSGKKYKKCCMQRDAVA